MARVIRVTIGRIVSGIGFSVTPFGTGAFGN